MPILMELPETIRNLAVELRLSFDDFEKLCAVTDNVRLGLTSEGLIIVNAPARRIDQRRQHGDQCTTIRLGEAQAEA